MKTCFKCGETKEINEFYKHKFMADGHLGKCKVCTRQYMKDDRRADPEKYSERERARYTGERKAKILDRSRLFALEHPDKRKAHNAVNNAVRDGRLEKPDACSSCGRVVRLEGHHDDYTKPLDVIWFCCRCHRRYHAANPHIMR